MIRRHLQGEIALEAVVAHILLQVFTPLIRFFHAAVLLCAAGPADQGLQLPGQLLHAVKADHAFQVLHQVPGNLRVDPVAHGQKRAHRDIHRVITDHPRHFKRNRLLLQLFRNPVQAFVHLLRIHLQKMPLKRFQFLQRIILQGGGRLKPG